MTPRRIVRAVPTAGTTEDVGGLSFTDPVEGGNAFVFETFHEHGFPASLIKIATTATSSENGRLYPYDGSSPVLPSDHGATNGGTTLKLATGAVPVAGLLVQIVSGSTALGLCRRVVSVSGVTATLNRAWATAEGIPAMGDGYRLLIDLRQAKHLNLKGEYSASGGVATVMPVYYDWPFTQAGVARPSIAMADQVLDLANTGVQGETQESSYYHGVPIPITTKGFFGAKVRQNAITTGSWSLWATTT